MFQSSEKWINEGISWLWGPYASYDSTLLLRSTLMCICGASGVFLLLRLFAHGHEEYNTPRSFLTSTNKELQELQQKFRYESTFMTRPRGERGEVAKIYTCQWFPPSTPKGIVLLIHGLNDHSGRLAHVARDLLEQGLAVYSLDLEGFGQSSGRHGYFYDATHLVDDILAYIDVINEAHPGTKLFLHGGSLGGLLIIHSVLTSRRDGKLTMPNIHGAVLLAPAIQIHPASRPHRLVEAMAAWAVHVVPKLPIAAANKKKSSSVSVADANEAAKAADPLFYSGKLRIGTGLAIQRAMQQVQAKLHEFDLPFLLQHGKSDRVCHVSGSELFYQVSQSVDKTIITYDDAEHDLTREPRGIVEKLKSDYISWLLDRI